MEKDKIEEMPGASAEMADPSTKDAPCIVDIEEEDMVQGDVTEVKEDKTTGDSHSVFRKWRTINEYLSFLSKPKSRESEENKPQTLPEENLSVDETVMMEEECESSDTEPMSGILALSKKEKIILISAVIIFMILLCMVIVYEVVGIFTITMKLLLLIPFALLSFALICFLIFNMFLIKRLESAFTKSGTV